MKFLTGLTLNLDKIPKYTAFTGDFVLDIGENRRILENCCITTNSVFNKEIRDRIETILDNIYKNNNNLIVKHHQKFNIGRFYPNESISLITLSRHAKHTLFSFMNWIDIDMIKGHPTILYNLFKDIYEPTSFKKYIENPDGIFNKLLDFYAVDDTLNKDHIKKIFNIAIYGGSFKTWLKEMDEKNIELKTDEIHIFIQEFINECKEISNIIFKNNTKLADKIRKYYTDEKDEWKIKNKVISYFCQAIENEILHIAYKFLIKQNIITPRKNVELEYDGLCFKMPENINMEQLENIVIELNDKILKDTTLNVKFKIKPYDDRYIHSDIIEKTTTELIENNSLTKEEEDDDKTITDNYELEDDILQLKEEIYECNLYRKTRAEFEKSYFKLEFPLCYICEETHETSQEIKQYKPNQLGELVRDKGLPTFYVVHKNKTITPYSFIDLWKDDINKRKYKGIVFEPNPAFQDKNYYNLFKGFRNDDPNIESINEEDSYFFKLLKHITKTEPKLYNYFIAIIAHIIQHPYKKTNTAFVMNSFNKGIGKDSIIAGIKNIIGIEYFGKISDIEDIAKKFNADLINKLIIYGEEITANAKKLVDKLKQVITQTEIKMEKKGYDAIIVKDYANFFFTTNNRNSFKIEVGDRRFTMLECNESFLEEDFFNKFYEEINDPIKIKQLFRFFKLYKQDTYNIGKGRALDTRYKQELEYESKQGYIQFLYKCVNSYSNMSCISSTKFYEMSKEFCNKNYISSHFTINEFGTAINKILIKFRVRKSTGYVFNFTNSLDVLQTLYNYDPTYYRYINNLEADFIPCFTPEPELINHDIEEIEY